MCTHVINCSLFHNHWYQLNLWMVDRASLSTEGMYKAPDTQSYREATGFGRNSFAVQGLIDCNPALQGMVQEDRIPGPRTSRHRQEGWRSPSRTPSPWRPREAAVKYQWQNDLRQVATRGRQARAPPLVSQGRVLIS